MADIWTHVEGEGELPTDDVAVTVDAARWSADRDRLIARSGPLGVRLANNDPVDLLAEDLGQLALIVLHFPKFSDGRAYSQARRLRRLGFAGELRATGNVLQDQLLLMTRVGFDGFVMAAPDAERRYEAALAAYDHFYQPRRIVAA
ncbi:hypothetical protein STHU_32770 [Allostella humosa]|nr:hypothetical protein STHU_32770 [Stella humosa]